MREIKFRIWDKINKLMTDENSKVNELDKKYCAFNNDMGWFYVADEWYPLSEATMIFTSLELLRKYKDEIVLMQYIGFEDNNGKKIYEGDIINIDYGEVVVKAVVEYCGTSFFGSTNADNWDLNEYHKIEVLGNIYENPELMED